MYKLGLVSISFRKNTIEEIMSAMQSAGLSYIEWGSDVHAPCNDENRLKQICELQKKYKIECCSYGTYFKLGETPIEELESYIKAAKILGANILRLWCGDTDSENCTPSQKEQLFSVCKKAAEIAEKNQVILCMECHNNSYTQYLSGAIELMEYVNSPSFRMYWQPNQLRELNQNIEYAKNISPYTKHIHVFQWSESERFSLWDGVEEWKKFLTCFSGDNFLLLEFMPDDKIESLEKEAQALRQIVGEL